MTQDDREGDQREHPRRPFLDPVILLAGERAWLLRAVNVSPGGIGLERPPGFPLEAETIVRLIFPARPGPIPVLSARIAWIDAAEIGCEYHEPQPVPPGWDAAPR